MIAANLALDRSTVFRLDTLDGRANLLTRLELLDARTDDLGGDLGRHWEVPNDVVRDTLGPSTTRRPTPCRRTASVGCGPTRS